MSRQQTTISTESSSAAPPLTGLGRVLIHPVFLGLLLIAVTLAVYWPVLLHDFINFDDPDYVTENRHVLSGLSGSGVAWAFVTFHSSNWHPMTWLTHMLDVTFFGTRPWGHYLTNLLLHTANAVLLFTLLRRMTGALWRSAMVAALFALHPLHVESVAWVSERKDVLSAFFGLLSLIFYVRYVQSQIVNRKSKIINYAWALIFFALGLMSKPMLVTWPFVMLLLDYWPLKRFPISDFRFAIWKFVREKLPFFVLSAVSSGVTCIAQKQSVISTILLPMDKRLVNAVVSYARYLGKTFWPVNLSIFYPPKVDWRWEQVTGALLLVVVVLLAAIWLGRRRPYFLVGWLWFLGTLVPVIGLVQVGGQSMADRYTYLPLIGVFIALIWGVGEWFSRWRLSPVLVGVMGVLLALACAWRTEDQLRSWQNTGTVFRHAVTVTEKNAIAHVSLGSYLFDQGQAKEAVVQFQKALEASPELPQALNALGMALCLQGRAAEGVPYFRRAVKIAPNFNQLWNNLGLALVDTGQYSEAVAWFQKFLKDDPGDPQVHFNLGRAFYKSGRFDDAIQEFRWVLQHAPDYSGVQQQLGLALLKKGESREAIGYLRAAVKLNPDTAEALNSLAWVLATSPDAQLRDGVEAVKLAERAVQVTHHDNPGVLDTLAAAYAEAGRFEDAMAMAQKALELAGASGKVALANGIRGHLDRYKTGQPWRE